MTRARPTVADTKQERKGMSPQDFQENEARLIEELRQLARRGAPVIQMVHHLHLEPNRCGRVTILVSKKT